MSLQDIIDADLLPLIGSHLVTPDSRPRSRMEYWAKIRDLARLHGDINVRSRPNEIWMPRDAQEPHTNIERAVRDLVSLQRTSRTARDRLRDAGSQRLIDTGRELLKLYLKEGPPDQRRLGENVARSFSSAYTRPADEPGNPHPWAGMNMYPLEGGWRDIQSHERFNE